MLSYSWQLPMQVHTLTHTHTCTHRYTQKTVNGTTEYFVPLKIWMINWIWNVKRQQQQQWWWRRWSLPVWPDWAIYWTMGHFLKPLAAINLPKSPTFLGNFCKGVKIFHFSSEIIFGQLWSTFGDFSLVTLNPLLWRFTRELSTKRR